MLGKKGSAVSQRLLAGRGGPAHRASRRFWVSQGLAWVRCAASAASATHQTSVASRGAGSIDVEDAGVVVADSDLETEGDSSKVAVLNWDDAWEAAR